MLRTVLPGEFRGALMRVWRALRPIVGAAVLATGGWPGPAGAEKIEAALARAYQNNPQLNAQRAIVRQTDEGVPQALSGYRAPSASRNRSIPGRSASLHPKTCSTPRPRTGRGPPKAGSSPRARRCA
jgi:outer membrane protein